MHNPYAPPQRESSPVDAPNTDKQERWYATRARRLVAWIIDAVLIVFAALIIGRVAGALVGIPATPLTTRLEVVAASIPQWALIVMRGQTVGKMLLKIEIVRPGVEPPGFLHGVVLRVWPAIALGSLVFLSPSLRSIGPLWICFDGAFIFRRDRRCLHDLIAGTYVVNALR